MRDKIKQDYAKDRGFSLAIIKDSDNVAEALDDLIPKGEANIDLKK